jgi:hypothetical protein
VGTDADGHYRACDLVPGTCRIEFAHDNLSVLGPGLRFSAVSPRRFRSCARPTPWRPSGATPQRGISCPER